MSKFKDLFIPESIVSPAWWLLTSLRFSPEEILERKARVETILESHFWVSIIDQWDNYGIDLSQLPESQMSRFWELLWENSILVDALEYKENPTSQQWSSIEDIVSSTHLLLAKLTNSNKVDIYNLADVLIWNIIADLNESIRRGCIKLDETDTQSLKDLEDARSSLLRICNWNYVIVG